MRSNRCPVSFSCVRCVPEKAPGSCLSPGVEGSALCQPSPLSSLQPAQNSSFPPKLLILSHGSQAKAHLAQSWPQGYPPPPCVGFEA